MEFHFDILARTVLAPVLIWQGIKLRRSALVLPEAAGSRQGVTGTGPKLRLLIVGDSSAAGVGVDLQKDALCGQVLAGLSQHHHVTWRLLAKSGATTKTAITMLDNAKGETFDVAILALGVNDAARLTPLRIWRHQQARLRKLLGEELGVQRIIVTAVPPLGQFPALPRLLQWILGAHAGRMDEQLQRDLDLERGTAHLGIEVPAHPSAMAKDGYHPSQKTYAQWGLLVAEKIRRNGQVNKV